MSRFWRTLCFSGASLLSACISTPELPSDAASVNAASVAWAARQQQLGAVTGFVASGRVAITGGGLSGALRWQQDGDYFALRIVGPFGAGALALAGTPQRLSIKGKDIDLITDEPERVLAERTGWRLPLAALHWWLLGLPAPAPAASVVLDGAGRALQIQQGDWTLRYSDYAAETLPALPGRIQAVQGDWSATLIITELTLKP